MTACSTRRPGEPEPPGLLRRVALWALYWCLEWSGPRGRLTPLFLWAVVHLELAAPDPKPRPTQPPPPRPA